VSQKAKSLPLIKSQTKKKQKPKEKTHALCQKEDIRHVKTKIFNAQQRRRQLQQQEQHLQQQLQHEQQQQQHQQ